MVIREGRNREVRRLLASVGHEVLRLRRVGFGPLCPRGSRPRQVADATHPRGSGASAVGGTGSHSRPLVFVPARLPDQRDEPTAHELLGSGSGAVRTLGDSKKSLGHRASDWNHQASPGSELRDERSRDIRGAGCYQDAKVGTAVGPPQAPISDEKSNVENPEVIESALRLSRQDGGRVPQSRPQPPSAPAPPCGIRFRSPPRAHGPGRGAEGPRSSPRPCTAARASDPCRSIARRLHTGPVGTGRIPGEGSALAEWIPSPEALSDLGYLATATDLEPFGRELRRWGRSIETLCLIRVLSQPFSGSLPRIYPLLNRAFHRSVECRGGREEGLRDDGTRGPIRGSTRSIPAPHPEQSRTWARAC